MNPTADPHAAREIVRVEIQPNERWTGGSTVPIQAFQVFHLPQDAVSYSSKKRSDIVDRCMSRVGRFLSYFTHILEEFKNDVEGEDVSRLAADLSAMGREKKKFEDQYIEVERRVGELSTTNSKLSKQVGEMELARDMMSTRIDNLEKELREMTVSRNEEKGERETAEAELSRVLDSNKSLVEENDKLKVDVQKGVEDIAKVLGDGYGRCLIRLSKFGVDVTGYFFEEYVQDFALEHAALQDPPAHTDT
ncbi:uncharacterized protein LOC141723650 [Apium graveolens]|uniref:uncharacterized protein LOC141723650 n=1 Tax=Apium graveolens TaxID=4045 RepID=UPI003D7AFE76